MPTLTLGLPNFGPAPGGGWRSVVHLAVRAEAAGIDRIVVTDHVVMGRNTDAYTWGRFPVPPDAAWLEPLTLLASMAVVTERLRLCTGILIAPLRPAALLAKTVATLDVLSEGRIDLGVGTGWQREEYLAEGLRFEQRGQLLTDTIGACRALWGQTPATFHSPTIEIDDIFCMPKPVQARLPVWFSGVLHARNVARVVELGDGWIPIMGATVEDIAHGAQRLRQGFVDAGRDPAALRVQGSPAVRRDAAKRADLGATMRHASELLSAGATDINVNIRSLDPDLDVAVSRLPELVEQFRSIDHVAPPEERR